MYFGNLIKLSFFYELRPILGSGAIEEGRGGGGVVTDFVTNAMKPDRYR